ncbi:MAG: DUF2680 domain-containing protein [Desulfitobacteriaceae bacterium]
MKKKLVTGVLSVVLLVGGAAAALGTTDSAKLDEIKSLTQQMFGIHKQIVDKEVGAGLITQEQADKMKQLIDQRQQFSDQAIANGQVFGLGKEMHSAKEFNNGQPMTEEQIKAWSDSMQARLKVQEEAMKNNGKLTAEQIKVWSDASQAQLKVQEEALKSGTSIPGGIGGIGGMGKRGGHGDGFCGSPIAPNANVTQ